MWSGVIVIWPLVLMKRRQIVSGVAWLVAGEVLAEVVVGGGGPDGEGGVEVDVERDGGAERVEVEAADRFGEALLDRHPFGVPADDLLRRRGPVVGEDQGRVLVPEAAHGDLA